MTDDDFRLFRSLIHRECGIYLNDSKKSFLEPKTRKRLESLGMHGFFSYYRHLTSPEGRDELTAFIDSVTINETSFFRNQPQFAMFREKVISEMADRKRREKDYSINIWSAGCSTGEEPYSIAMELSEAIPDISRWKARILASDISLKCLQTADRGVYPKEKLKDVPDGYASRHFNHSGEDCSVKPHIRKLVVLDYHNLIHENGMPGMDVVFCRNVMIYFETDEQKRLVERFRKVLCKGGYLFLGHAETLHGISNGDFRFTYWNKGTAYQKVTEGGHG